MNAEPGAILVVDDNENNRDMLSRRLERRGHSVRTAEDGTVALAQIAEHPFDLILLDIMMPGIDGFEVLRRIRTEHSATRLPVIMATAKDDRGDIVEALKLGANDYVTKPLDFPVVVARVDTQLSLKRSVDKIIALERDLAERNEALQSANDRMSADLRAAARVQQSLLPDRAPDFAHVGCAWRFLPCDELGGDILNVYKLTDTHLGFYLLDVSGHGVPASLLSVTLSRILTPVPDQSSLVRRRRETDASFAPVPPAEVAAELNRRFPMDENAEQYFTLFYGVLNTETLELTHVCAGHPAPVLTRAGGQVEVLEEASFPIGWVPDLPYQSRTLQLCPGDRLYLYSDGVNEARDQQRQLLGTQRIAETLAAARQAPLAEALDTLLGRARAWTVGDFDDDVSLLAIEVTA